MTTSMRYDDPFGSPAMQGMNNRQKAAEMFKDMGRGMWKSGKGWGLLGLMFSGIECCIESVRCSRGTRPRPPT
jgi:import inner membrane translocase subunit TIM22